MSRPSSYNLLLTPEEYVSVSYIISREYKAFMDGNRQLRRKMAQSNRIALSDLQTKLDGPFEMDGLAKGHILKCNRVQARYLQNLITPRLSALLTKIIPGYMDRIAKETDATEKARLQEYLEKTQSLAKTLTNVLNQINERL